MRLLVYTLFRLGLVLAAAGLLYLLGLRSWVLWVVAVVIGALVSFLVLGRQREEAARVLAQYDPLREERPTFSPEVEADAAYEDAVVDAAAGRREPAGEVPVAGSAVGEESGRADDFSAAPGGAEDVAAGPGAADDQTGPARHQVRPADAASTDATSAGDASSTDRAGETGTGPRPAS